MNNLKKFYNILSKINYDAIFFDAKTNKNIPFKEIFPEGKYAIIGNSSSLLENQHGSIINKYDNVIRFNNYQTDNYEVYTGKKTDIWITGAGVQSSSVIPDNNAKKVLVVPKLIPFQTKKMQYYLKYKSNEFIIFHNDFVMRLMTSLVGGTPTTGMIMILLLSVKYNSIDTFGFSFCKINNKYHYYNDKVVMDGGHRWNAERSIYDLLLKIQMINRSIKNYSISDDTNNKLEELKKIL